MNLVPSLITMEGIYLYTDAQMHPINKTKINIHINHACYTSALAILHCILSCTIIRYTH